MKTVNMRGTPGREIKRNLNGSQACLRTTDTHSCLGRKLLQMGPIWGKYLSTLVLSCRSTAL